MAPPRTPARPMPKLHRAQGLHPDARSNPGAVLAYHCEPTAPLIARTMGVRIDRPGDWMATGMMRVAVLVARMDGASVTARWAHVTPATWDKLTETAEGRDPATALRPLLTTIGRMGKRLPHNKAKEIFGWHILTDAGPYSDGGCE